MFVYVNIRNIKLEVDLPMVSCNSIDQCYFFGGFFVIFFTCLQVWCRVKHTHR